MAFFRNFLIFFLFMKDMSFTAEKIMYENTAKIKMCANQFPKTEKEIEELIKKLK